MKRAGVDTGGTFTDFVFFEEGVLRTAKLLSTPENPALAVLKGLRDEAYFLVHGTTVATNAFLEGKTARTALVTTEGFRNLLQIGRQTRVNLFARVPQKPPEIIPEELCFVLRERVLYDGKVQVPLSREEIEALAEVLEGKGVEAVAVVFLHSYANPSHEKLAGEVFSRKFKVSLSHQVLNEHREYERAVATALNASLLPVMEDYLDLLEEKVKGEVYIMNSAGGFISASLTRRMPVLTLLSGPAGGVMASYNLGKLLSLDRIITLDMGGTSTDVSLIKGGLSITRSASLSHLPLRIPMVDIQTVGTGGGSIAWVDDGGALRVGPQSAGAVPGPACYGRSEIPTLTDALVVLGRIREEFPLGEGLKIKPERSYGAIGKIAEEISTDLYRAAEGILEVSLANTERAVKLVSLERGEDPGEFTLMAFGGAGGLVAAELAQRLGIPRVVIPPLQGVFSALGMLLSDGVREYSASFLKELSRESVAEARERFAEMEQDARRELGGEALFFERICEMRYRGQGYEIAVPFNGSAESLLGEFSQLHLKLYYHTQDRPVEIVNLRLRAVLPTEKPKLPEVPRRQAEPVLEAEVYHRGRKMGCLFYRKEDLGEGTLLKGPSVVTSNHGTVYIPPDFVGRVGVYGEIWIEGKNVRSDKA